MPTTTSVTTGRASIRAVTPRRSAWAG
jgi:hypothetical protein